MNGYIQNFSEGAFVGARVQTVDVESKVLDLVDGDQVQVEFLFRQKEEHDDEEDAEQSQSRHLADSNPGPGVDW